jgi:hypothetical protein
MTPGETERAAPRMPGQSRSKLWVPESQGRRLPDLDFGGAGQEMTCTAGR